MSYKITPFRIIELFTLTAMLLLFVSACGSSSSNQELVDADHDGIWDVNDPYSNDTDNDGLDDKVEFNLGTSPVSKDSDGDGWSDNDEVGTDLNNVPDFDGDGIIDALDYYLVFNFRNDDGSEILHERFGMATDDDGNIYVANYFGDSIKMFNRSGTWVRDISSNLSLPNDMAFSSNHFFIADMGNNRIVKTALDGTIEEVFVTILLASSRLISDR